jgi:outer membrane murein-binding lipoprotein Lpp
MKGAKELAEMLKRAADRYAEVCGLSLSQETARTIADHLDAKAAIDSAVPGEVGEIQQRADEAHLWDGCPPARCDEAEKDRATLLAIVQRQAGELIETRRARDAANERLEAARAEVERLKDLVDEFKAATMLDVNGDPDGVTPRLLEGHVTALRTEIDRLQSERAALANDMQKASDDFARALCEHPDNRTEDDITLTCVTMSPIPSLSSQTCPSSLNTVNICPRLSLTSRRSPGMYVRRSLDRMLPSP